MRQWACVFALLLGLAGNGYAAAARVRVPDPDRAPARFVGARRAADPDARLVARLKLRADRRHPASRRRVRSGSASLPSSVAWLLVQAGGGPARAVDRNDVRIFVQPPSTFDPAAQSDVATAAITAQLYETLTTYDAALQLQPALAASWDVAADGRRVVFHLAPG